MNRLEHLKQTLPKNIEDNISCGNVEFVVLNYNSKDELDNWIVSEMAEFLKTNTLKYYKTPNPLNFHRSHAKNIVGKLATGEIICNVDADNYIGPGFANYIYDVFNRNNTYLSVDKKSTLPDFYGRICMLTNDFWTLRGYDERMNGYGFEDFDICNRLEFLGRNKSYIEDNKFLKTLTHGDNERLENEPNIKEIDCLFIRYIDHSTSELLYLLKSRDFFKGKIIANRLYNSENVSNLFRNYDYLEYSNRLEHKCWTTGKWSIQGNLIQLKTFKSGQIELIGKNGSEDYDEITEKTLVAEAIMFFSQINNRLIMDGNKQEKIISVNKRGFGVTDLLLKYSFTKKQWIKNP